MDRILFPEHGKLVGNTKHTETKGGGRRDRRRWDSPKGEESFNGFQWMSELQWMSERNGGCREQIVDVK